MNRIYIIHNPKFSRNSLINITEETPKDIIFELNDKYTNQESDNDFYKFVYIKEIDGEISNLSSQIKRLFKDYIRPKSEFYNITSNLAIELLENQFFKKEISNNELLNWWNSLNNSWKYTFEKKMFPQTRQNEEGTNLDKVTSTELRKLTFIENLTIWRKEIKSLEPLKIFKNLKKLNCSVQEISDLKPLEELYKLEELNIVDTNIESLKPISSLLNLKTLYCFRTKIKSIKEILHLTSLEIIKTNYNTPISELNIIRKNNPNCKVN